MARYIGPKTKIAKRFGEPIFGENKFSKKKQYKKFHRNSRKRFKKNDYVNQLFEKQKLKYIYGILERQCRKIFRIASRIKGNTGNIFLQLLERRIDNVIYRLGLSKSRAAARQLICHGHIKINSIRVNIPSYIVNSGDKIKIIEKSKYHPAIRDSLQSRRNIPVKWLTWNEENMEGVFQYIPEREHIPEKINEQLIVEWFSK